MDIVHISKLNSAKASEETEVPCEAGSPGSFVKFGNQGERNAPKTIESQVSDMTVTGELAHMNKSMSSLTQFSSNDMEEVQKLRRVEYMKMPVHAKMAMRAKEFLAIILAFFSGKKKKSMQPITATGKKAILQLRQIAALYSAMPHKSLEETIMFDAAFGKAYYEILSNSYQIAKGSGEEKQKDLGRYQSAIDGFIEAMG